MCICGIVKPEILAAISAGTQDYQHYVILAPLIFGIFACQTNIDTNSIIIDFVLATGYIRKGLEVAKFAKQWVCKNTGFTVFAFVVVFQKLFQQLDGDRWNHRD